MTDFFSGNDAAGALQQKLKNSERLLLKPNRVSHLGELAALEINFERSEAGGPAWPRDGEVVAINEAGLPDSI